MSNTAPSTLGASDSHITVVTDLNVTLANQKAKLAAARELNAITSDVWSVGAVPAGDLEGQLAGVTVLVKDNIDVVGYPTTFGADAHHLRRIPTETAPVVQALQDQGAVVVAKTNLHEFCWGMTSQNPFWGFVKNPLSPDHVSGGSSGGNAAALGAGFGAVAVGSDTGGSVRIPAACCGIVGYKPRRSSLSTSGFYPLAKSLDTVGVMGRSLDDVLRAYQVLVETTFSPISLDGVRVGVISDTPIAAMLADTGAAVRGFELDFPGSEFDALMQYEAAEVHRACFTESPETYSPDLRNKLGSAMTVDRADAFAARKRFRDWQNALADRMDVDLLVSPTIEGPVPRLTAEEFPLRTRLSKFTKPFNYLDWPALALGNAQIAGRDEAMVLGAALAIGAPVVQPEFEEVLAAPEQLP